MESCHFPSEIFPIIFDQVEADQDLFSLASSSATFNYLALKVYFSRHQLDPNTQNVQLPPSPKWTFQQLHSYLHALLLSLETNGREITHLSYQYNSQHAWVIVVQQAQMMKRLLDRLGKIHELKLTLFTPSIGHKEGIGQANADLLDTVRRMDCRHLQLSGSSMIYTKSAIGQGPKKLEFKNIGESSLPLLWIQKKLSIGGQTRNKDPDPNSQLTRLKIDSFPFAFRQFSLDVLQINALNLTHLHLLRILECSEIDFTTFLMNIDLPSLTVLMIRSCNRIHQKSLFDFIVRHSGSITNLCYTLDTWGGYTVPLPLAKLKVPPILKNLQQICVTLSYMPHFFTSTSSLASLNKIILSSTSTTSSDGEEILTDAIKALQGCDHPLALVFSSSWSDDEFGQWFKRMDLSGPRPESSLTCVRSVNLSYLHRGFTPDEVEYLPTWFGLFPALEEICLEVYKAQLSGQNVATNWSKVRSREVGERLKGVCPAIRKFSVIKGGTLSLAWTFDQGCKTPVFVTA